MTRLAGWKDKNMNYTEALEKLLDDHCARQTETYDRIKFPPPGRDELALATNYRISTEVGHLVDSALDYVDYGTFDNAREWGLTFSTGVWTFCVYELRGGDRIQIQGCPTAEMQDYGPYGGNPDSSIDTLYSAPEGSYGYVAHALTAMLTLAADNAPHTREELSSVAWAVAS